MSPFRNKKIKVEETEINAYSEAGYDGNSSKPRLAWDVLRVVFGILLVMAIITAGSVFFVQVNRYRYITNQTAEFNRIAAQVEDDMKNRLNEVNDLFIAERVNDLFMRDDIRIFSYAFWKYELFVNDTAISPTTTELRVNPGDKIYIKETRNKTALPEEFVKVGNLTQGDENDRLSNHFTVSGKSYSVKDNKEGAVSTYTLEDLNNKSGDKFVIVFSVQLQERLGFEKEQLAVFVN
jgi:cell division protein FtsL